MYVLKSHTLLLGLTTLLSGLIALGLRKMFGGDGILTIIFTMSVIIYSAVFVPKSISLIWKLPVSVALVFVGHAAVVVGIVFISAKFTYPFPPYNFLSYFTGGLIGTLFISLSLYILLQLKAKWIIIPLLFGGFLNLFLGLLGDYMEADKTTSFIFCVIWQTFIGFNLGYLLDRHRAYTQGHNTELGR